MLSTTLKRIKHHLQINKIEEEKTGEFIKWFEDSKINRYVYPEVIVENTNLSENDCYKILSLLVQLGILKKVYKVFCPFCNSPSAKVFENFNEVEEYIICEDCDNKIFNELNPLKYLILFYKVISE